MILKVNYHPFPQGLFSVYTIMAGQDILLYSAKLDGHVSEGDEGIELTMFILPPDNIVIEESRIVP